MNTRAISGIAAGAIALALLFALPAAAQPGAKAAPQDAAKPESLKAAAPKPDEPAQFSYSSGGRRDPFKDLFGGQDIREKRVITGFADLYVDEIRIMGIVAAKGERVAIVSLPEGFPATVRAGDRFADGYVLAIDETQIVLRKMRDRGVPLQKPRDIVKEITPEELQDE